MKKAMLFFAAFLFSVSAHAATLNLATGGASNATQAASVINNNGALAIGQGETIGGLWSSAFTIVSDIDTPVNILWTFNAGPSTGSLSSAVFNFDGTLVPFSSLADFSYTAVLAANTIYTIALEGVISSALAYDVTVIAISEVPVPAALLLFAPALLGLIGLRRKAMAKAA